MPNFGSLYSQAKILGLADVTLETSVLFPQPDIKAQFPWTADGHSAPGHSAFGHSATRTFSFSDIQLYGTSSFSDIQLPGAICILDGLSDIVYSEFSILEDISLSGVGNG